MTGKMFERNVLGYVDGQCDIKNSVPDSFQEVRQIQAFNVQVRINQEIHIVLVHDNQRKSYRNQQFISFFSTACRKKTTPAPARIPTNTHQFSEMALRVSYRRIDTIKAF